MTWQRMTRRVALTTAVFLAMDFVWLGLLMPGFYKAELGALARVSGPDFAPIWWSAVAVYACLVAGIVVFVLPQAEGRPARALVLGAVLGIVTYGTYDFTAYAVLAGWSLRMTVIDVLWGAVICGVSSAAAIWLEPRVIASPVVRPAAGQHLL